MMIFLRYILPNYFSHPQQGLEVVYEWIRTRSRKRRLRPRRSNFFSSPSEPNLVRMKCPDILPFLFITYILALCNGFHEMAFSSLHRQRYRRSVPDVGGREEVIPGWAGGAGPPRGEGQQAGAFLSCKTSQSIRPGHYDSRLDGQKIVPAQ